MKLNHDCIRAILCHIEDADNFLPAEIGVEIDLITADALYESLEDFKKEDICYSLIILDEAGFIDADLYPAEGAIYDAYIRRLTYAGHEYIESIRDDKTWANVKKVLGKIGNASLSVITAVSEGFANAAIEKYLKGELTI